MQLMEKIGTKIVMSVIGVLSVLLSGCERRETAPLMVGTNVWPGYECLYLAREMGYYDESKIKLVEFHSSTDVMRAYRNGIIDVAALTLDEALQVRESIPDTKVFLVVDISSGADAILSRGEIKNMQGLKGKRVGVESTALGGFVLARALETARLSIEDVVPVFIEVDGHEEAFKTGKVDAVVTFEPIRSNLARSGARVIFESTEIPGEIIDVLVARAPSIDRRNDDFYLIAKGWFRALEYMNSNPGKASVIMARREGIPPEQFMESMKGLIIPSVDDNLKMLGEGSALKKGTERLGRFMLDKGLLRSESDLSTLFDDRIIKKDVKI